MKKLLFFLAVTISVQTMASKIVRISAVHNKLLMLHFDDGKIIQPAKGTSRGEGILQEVPIDSLKMVSKATYKISSSNDASYTNIVNPSAIYRKSKPTEFRGRWGFNDFYNVKNHVMEHYVYLELATALKSGAKYKINTGTLAEGGNDFYFVYDEKEVITESIHVNQLAYINSSAKKFAYLYYWAGSKGGIDFSAWVGKPFKLVSNTDNTTAFTGTIAARKVFDNAETAYTGSTINGNYHGVATWECDFSAFTGTGEYKIVVDGIGCSFTFRIEADAFREAMHNAAKGIYFQRSGEAWQVGAYTKPADHNPVLTPGFATRMKYSTARIYDATSTDAPSDFKAEIESKAKGTLNISGWYQDAGDWDSYYSHAIVPAYLLTLFEIAPNKFVDNELNIPESGNGIPDMLDEAAHQVRFYYRMRKELIAKGYGTGGVGGSRIFGDLWGSGEDSDNSAADVNRDWYCLGEDPWMTLRYAGLAAQMGICLKKICKTDPQGIDWQKEAIEAYNWANANVKSTDYPVKYDFDFVKERAYAAANIYRLTAIASYNTQFVTDMNDFKADTDIKSGLFSSMAPYMYALSPSTLSTDAALMAKIKTNIESTADFVAAYLTGESRAMRWAGNFWQPLGIGQATTPMVFNIVMGHNLLKTSNPTKALSFINVIQTTCDYFLGTNPLNITWISGVGERYPIGIFKMDSFYSGTPVINDNTGYNVPTIGYVPYGPHGRCDWWGCDGASGSLSTHYSDQYVFPKGQTNWPGHEWWFDQRPGIPASENTVWQTGAPSLFAYAYLCAEPVTNLCTQATAFTPKVYSQNTLRYPYQFTVCTDPNSTCGSIVTTPKPNLVDVLKITPAPVIDGKTTESYWTLDKKIEKNTVGTSDNLAQFDTKWDNTNLYISINVSDKSVNGTGGVSLFDQDGIELYIDANNGKTATYETNDFQFGFGYSTAAAWESTNRTTGVVFAFSQTTGGYSFEVKIPWTTLGITPAANLKFGLDVAVNDNDNGTSRGSQLMWNGNGDNWTNTSAWGEAKLSNSLITSTEYSYQTSSLAFPNPFTSSIYLSKPQSWILYNNVGQKIKNGNSNEINGSELLNGLYLLQLEDGSIHKLKK